MRRFARIARRVTTLSIADWRVLAAAYMRLWQVRIALNRRPFAAFYRDYMEGAESAAGSITDRSLSEIQIAWCVNVASRLVPDPTCLVKAMAAHRLFRMEGYTSVVRIGVQRNAQETFGAHAWVEIDGSIVIGGRQSLDFAPLPSLDAITKTVA